MGQSCPACKARKFLKNPSTGLALEAANGKLASDAKNMPSAVFPELVAFSEDMMTNTAGDELRDSLLHSLNTTLPYPSRYGVLYE